MPTEEHMRKVDLMLMGAWDSPVYALWKKQEEPLTESVIEIAERISAEHGIGGQQ